MSINIHGKEYVMVNERVSAAHDELAELDITTEVLYQEPVVIKATVKTKKGIFTGISAANPAKAIEKQSPYEVAETSAVGRALGFAGYGIVESIASADEMAKASAETPTSQPKTVSTPKANDVPSCPDCGGDMWDNRGRKTNPKAPDFKCKDPKCGGVIWPPKNQELPERQVDEVVTAKDDTPPPHTDNEIDIEEIPF